MTGQPVDDPAPPGEVPAPPDADGSRAGPPGTRSGWVAAFLLLAVLAVLGYLVLSSFIVPLLWAGILAYIAWPLHVGLRRLLKGRARLAAAVTTALVAIAIVLPLTGLAVLLRDEMLEVFRSLREHLAADGSLVPRIVTGIPWIGPRLVAWLEGLSADPTALAEWLTQSADQWIGVGRDLVGAIGRNLFKLAIAIVALFFFLRDGEIIASQARRVLERFLGPVYEAYWHAVETTTRGVVYGLVLTALAQGLLAGLGYWVAGTPVPILIGGLTALFALIPFGAPLVWGSAGVALLLAGDYIAGIGLLLWGALVVSWIDNLVRPLAISTATRTPFLLVLMGVLGGLGTFGLVGLFVGPMVLAVLLAVWREWLRLQGAETAATPDRAPP